MNEKPNPYPEGWRAAFTISNRRYIQRWGWWDTPVSRACINPNKCPMSRKNRCIAGHCIGRYPTEETLFEFVK